MRRRCTRSITLYETGLDSDREAFDIAWVQNRDSAVDTMNGFIEVYMDARGMKGAWEGVVYYANHEKTDKIRALATHAQWFEDHLPIDPKYRKPTVQGVSAQAIEVVVEAGDSGPITPIGVNLPNDQRIRETVRQQVGVAVERARRLRALDARQLPPGVRVGRCGGRARARRWGAFAGELTTEIHEVLGHGSGRMADHVTVTPQDLLKEQYSALEETRADLVALYFVADPYLAEIGLVPADEQQAVVQTEYEAYARNALVQLRRVRVGAQLEEDHMRNRQAIVHWLLANTRAIDVRDRDEKTYFVVDRHRRVPRRRGAAARRSAAHQVGRRLRGGEGAVRNLRRAFRPRAARRGRRARRSPEPAVVHGIRDAEAGAGEGRRRRHHRREDLVSLRPDRVRCSSTPSRNWCQAPTSNR